MLVDDEQEALDLLGFFLAKYEQFKVVAKASNVDKAIQLLKETDPDLVLLDIQMPDKDGFQFIEEMNGLGFNPGVIFVTAFENYAIKALRNSAFDYILKPVKFDELLIAIERFTEKRGNQNDVQYAKLLSILKQSSPGKVKLNTRSGYILLSPEEIVHCKADGNYTHIQLLSEKIEIVAQNLGSIEKILEKHRFFRVSRSYLINLDYLSRVNRKTSTCSLEFNGREVQINTPAQKIRLLENYFNQN